MKNTQSIRKYIIKENIFKLSEDEEHNLINSTILNIFNELEDAVKYIKKMEKGIINKLGSIMSENNSEDENNKYKYNLNFSIDKEKYLLIYNIYIEECNFTSKEDKDIDNYINNLVY